MAKPLGALPRRLMLVAVLIPLALIITLLVIGSPGSRSAVVVTNLANLFAAGLAAASAVHAARRTSGRFRRSWRAFAVGFGAWFLGQLTWNYYELILGHRPNGVYFGDAAYLVTPVAIALGFWWYPTQHNRALRWRHLLDALLVMSSVVATVISLVPDYVTRANAVNWAGLAFTLLYPIFDMIVVSIATYRLTRPGDYRATLRLLHIAIVVLALTDTAYWYLSAMGLYQGAGTISDAGWCAAFLLAAVAGRVALTDTKAPSPAETPTLSAAMLPYVPVIVAGSVCTLMYLQGTPVSRVELVALGLALVALVARQFVTLRDNAKLLTALAESQAQLRYQAFNDRLTGLPNRARFDERVRHALELHRRDRRPMALLFCDLDGFKQINDTYGHVAGDEILIQVADRLRNALRAGDTIARYGGDEFAVLVEDGGDSASIGVRLVEAMRLPCTVEGNEVEVHLSIGVSDIRADDPSPDMDDLLAAADAAMYQAKRAGNSQVVVRRDGAAFGVVDLSQRTPLLTAISTGAVQVLYQPVVALAGNGISYLVARPQLPRDGDDLFGSEFLTIAERSGIGQELSRLLLQAVCRDLAQWDADGIIGLSVGFEPARSAITRADFAEQVSKAARQYGVSPDRLYVEVGTDALTSEPDLMQQVAGDLQAMGVKLTLGGFGVGTSVLIHLQRIAFDAVKIGAAFTETVDETPAAGRMFRAVVDGLHQNPELMVIVDGVTRKSQHDLLREAKCIHAQGDFYAPAREARLAVSTSAAQPAR